MLLYLILIISVFTFLWLRVDFGEISNSMGLLRLTYVPLILLCAVLNCIGRYIRWDYYLKKTNINVLKRDSFVFFMIGLLFSLTPGKVGELVKSYLIKEKYHTPISHSAPIIVAERITDLIAMSVLALVGFSEFRYGGTTLIVGFLLIGTLLIMLNCEKLGMFIIKRFNTVLGMTRLKTITQKIELGYLTSRHLLRGEALFVSIFIALSAWLFEYLAFYLVCRGLSVDISVLSALFIYSFSVLAGALSMLPAGIGGTEVSMAALLILCGISKAYAVAGTVTFRLCTLGLAILVGLIVISTEKISVLRRFEMKS